MFSHLVEHALRTAARAHQDHCRKGTDLPYLTHPVSVALLLVRAGFVEDELLAAALLHDVVEDTSVTLEQLAAEFPPLVIEYVAGLTERKLDDSGVRRSWQDRKADHLAHVATAPQPIRAVILADKLHNLGSMVFDLRGGERLWDRFNAPPDRVLWYLREMVAAAHQHEPILDGLARQCRHFVDELERSLAESKD